MLAFEKIQHKQVVIFLTSHSCATTRGYTVNGCPINHKLISERLLIKKIILFLSIILYITAIEGEHYPRSDRSESGNELALIRA